MKMPSPTLPSYLCLAHFSHCFSQSLDPAFVCIRTHSHSLAFTRALSQLPEEDAAAALLPEVEEKTGMHALLEEQESGKDEDASSSSSSSSTSSSSTSSSSDDTHRQLARGEAAIPFAEAAGETVFADSGVAPSLSGADVAAVVSSTTGIPLGNILEGERAGLLGLESQLAARVVGQPYALEAVAKVRRAMLTFTVFY